MANFMGKGREALDLILDHDSFVENQVGGFAIPRDFGPGAVVGTGSLKGKTLTVIANDGKVSNPRYPVVYAGIIGLEEAYKMALAVYRTIESDRGKALMEKRPILLIVDTPGNGPGKLEEIIGMNKATGAYQLALAQARGEGHPVIAMIIGRAISGAFLCHGLQADFILSLPAAYGTMIHVMPLTGIARIAKMDIETLSSLAKTNPVFATGADFFYTLGGIDAIVDAPENMADEIENRITQVYNLHEKKESGATGPWNRGALGAERGGRKIRPYVLAEMAKEFEALEESLWGN